VLSLRLFTIALLTALLALQLGASFWSLVITSRFITLDTRLSSAYGSFSERSRILRDGGMRQGWEVDPESPIGILGLRKDDLVVAVNGVRLTDDPGAYYRVFVHGSAGDPIELTWVRDGVERTGALSLAWRGGGRYQEYSWKKIALVKGNSSPHPV
jgi:hypothetical protein